MFSHAKIYCFQILRGNKIVAPENGVGVEGDCSLLYLPFPYGPDKKMLLKQETGKIMR